MPTDPIRVQALFRSAVGLPDLTARRAFLDRECGPDVELRAQVEAIFHCYDHPESLSLPTEAFALDLGATSAMPPAVPDTVAFHSQHDGSTDLPSANPAEESGADSRTPPIPEAMDAGTQQAEPAPTTLGDDSQGDNARLAVGRVIAGRYTLVKLIGEGGMGSVYLASQTEPVKRQVALKLIKAGMDSRMVLQRFEAERQALALMDHPNIARVFDGGTTPTGHPFFAMELVHGVAITKFCDQQRLGIRERLELFVTVCQAVQHAHQKGIIHRDLKPGNVLVTRVDGRPSPKVIDFGVAKATEQKLTDTSIADLGLVVGTPAYMSPEQADPTTLDIDTRTDVYALGVILYELLVGSPPLDVKHFKQGAIHEMLRMVREDEPPRPSTKLSKGPALPSIAANRNIDPAKLTQFLRGELDWVVMKAIDKDRARRYETASSFARDIERYLADEVVEARPPSRGYRLRKFIRRHRPQVIAASLVLATLLAGIAGTTVGLLRAREQRNLAEDRLEQITQANAKTEAERTRAEQNFGTARALILDLGTRINQIETGQANPRLTDLARKQALDKAREQFDQFRAGQPDDISLQKQAALLHRFAGSISRSLNDYKAALVAFGAAIHISEEMIRRFPEDRRLSDELALTLSDRGGVERLMGKSKDAAATLERAFKIAQGPQGKLTDSAYRRTQAMIIMDQADLAFTLGQFDEAARFALRDRELWDQVKAAPAAEKLNIDPLFAAMAVHRIALAERELGNTAKALTAHDDAVARMKSLNDPKATRDVRYWDCEVRRERARTLVAVPEQRQAALADLALVIAPSEKLIEENPHLYFYKAGLASTYLYRGELLLALGQPEQATAELTRSLAVSRELLDRHGVLTRSMLIRGNTFLALGRARAAAGKKPEALGHWKNAAKVFEIALTIDPDNVHHQRGRAEAEAAIKMVQ
jgi:serine/threonine protein kinase/tetratricopeptide (TPR) repeat protein